MTGTPEPADEVVLTAEEYDGVYAAVAAGAGPRPGGQRPTLNSLLEGWDLIVDEVAEGYSWSDAEFRNDIACRGILARVWPLLPPRVRAIRQPELDTIDDRFRAVTVPWPGRPSGEAWWEWRIPRLLDFGTGGLTAHGWPPDWNLPFPRPDTVRLAE
ncbi:hypothetical protein [Plantactinospora sp. BB1]|uniref:hypothetical protein n=1 Tax=Plantactinospora sp. BB1 TaxID=2071627 RepID=UPI000D1747B1|nr:hypothetical protein [Plantactinospora sp. BB1]AVT36907.1 hypothetical protein C6W10_10995 [Plantactinospora sp. BB1]